MPWRCSGRAAGSTSVRRHGASPNARVGERGCGDLPREPVPPWWPGTATWGTRWWSRSLSRYDSWGLHAAGLRNVTLTVDALDDELLGSGTKLTTPEPSHGRVSDVGMSIDAKYLWKVAATTT